jgi:hypothetical protein
MNYLLIKKGLAQCWMLGSREGTNRGKSFHANAKRVLQTRNLVTRDSSHHCARPALHELSSNN